MRHRRGEGIFCMIYEYVGFAILATVAAVSYRRSRRFAVIEVHSPPDFLIVAGLLPRLFGAKLVLDIRDLSPHMWDARFGGRPASRVLVWALRSVERFACWLADEVITVHEPYRHELVRHGVQAKKITVVMNTPDNELVRPIVETLDKHSPKGIFTVAYHGTITKWYGVDLLISAIAQTVVTGITVRGLVLGEGDALSSVRDLAGELGVADRIEFSGCYLPINAALRAVASADCGVISNLPSELNRFILPNKLFEYVALGVPVVAANLETIASHFDDSEVTFFEPGDAESLTEGLWWVATHPEAAAEKAVRAQARAETYSWSISRGRYLDVLERHAPKY